MTQILTFGNSIVYGAWDKEGGWVARLRKFLDEKTLSSNFESYYLVYGLGVSGGTTEELLNRFEFESSKRTKEGEETIIIFGMIAINDSQFIQSKKDIWYSPEQVKENVEKLIELAQKISQKIVFVGHTAVDETKTNPLPWNADKSYKNEYIKKYDEIIKTICQEKDIHFIDIMDSFMQPCYQDMLVDGLHPNSIGHEKIYEAVKDYLIKNNII